MLHHDVEDLGGEVAEERPEDAVVVGNLARMKSSISSTRAEVRHGVGRREARRPWPRAGLCSSPDEQGGGKYQSDQLEETTPREVRPGGPRSNRVRVSIGPIGDASSRFPSSLPAAPSRPLALPSLTLRLARARFPPPRPPSLRVKAHTRASRPDPRWRRRSRRRGVSRATRRVSARRVRERRRTRSPRASRARFDRAVGSRPDRVARRARRPRPRRGRSTASGARARGAATARSSGTTARASGGARTCTRREIARSSP